MTSIGARGFTLVETAVAMAVTSVLILAIMNFMANGFAQHSQQSARSNLLGDAHTALDIINKDIRLSASADQNNRWQDSNAPGAPTNLMNWQSDNDTLVLAVAALDTANNILFEDASKYISYKNNHVYFVEDQKLYKRILAAPITGNGATTTCPEAQSSAECPGDKELAENVSAFSVRYIDGAELEVGPADARAVELTLTLSTTSFKQPISQTYTTRMVFRNE